MRNTTFGAIAALALGAAVAAAPLPIAPQDAVAQESAQGGDEVLATVNGKEITATELGFALSQLSPALERYSPQQRPGMVLNLMIDMALIAEAAEKAGYGDRPEFQTRLDYYRAQTLRDLYMEELIGEKVTEEAVRARYEADAAEIAAQEEVSARHILVEEEEAAKEIIAELKGGAEFEALAAEHSIDPGSAQRGGSLGFFSTGQMVPPFEQAAFALSAGEMTEEPVQSRFGYHIIKVDERRQRQAPSFEEAESELRSAMIREAFIAEVAELKADATIERPNAAQ